MIRPTIAERARPRPPRASSNGSDAAGRGASDADPARALAGGPRRRSRARRGSYLELYRDRFGFGLDGLADQCRELLDSTERLYEETMDRRLAPPPASASTRPSSTISAG